MAYTFNYELDRDEETYFLEITYSATPYRPATYYQPAEGGEVEIISILEGGHPFPTSFQEDEAILAECHERAGEDALAEAADLADYRYEQYRDSLTDWSTH